MKIKKFIAASIKEGKAKVMEELGEEAVILSTRNTKSAIDNSELFEIVAAIDEKPVQRKPKLVYRPNELVDIQKPQKINDKFNEDLYSSAGQIFSELGALKTILMGVADNVKFKYSGALGPVFGSVYTSLRKSDISEELALHYVGRLSALKSVYDKYEAFFTAREVITEHIKILPPVDKHDGRRIAIFVGPTGSGKTSTLVKLAIICKIVLKANVLVVSADNFKIGGSEQLEMFASLASIPFQSVNNPKELSELVEKEKSRDFIFIDTTGRSYQNKEQIEELKSFVIASKSDITYLVQSTSQSESTFTDSLREYLKLNPNALILTKIDETSTFGAVISALKTYPLAIAYFTNGQSIPEDIEPASREKLGELVLPLADE